MTLGMLILAAAMQWYQIVKISHFSENNKKETLDIGRTVFQFIRRDLQSSGYRGCRTMDQNFPIYCNFEEKGALEKFLRIERPVFGFQAALGACQLHVPQNFCSHIKRDSDVLVIYNVPQKTNALKVSMTKPDDDIFVQGGETIQEGSMVLISDALQGDIFIANNVAEEKIYHQVGKNTTNSLSKSYQQNAEVTELQTIVYYLGIPDRPTTRSGSYSLFRSDILHKPQEIVEGIVDFSVEYGFWDSDDESNNVSNKKFQYYAASEIKPEQWAEVCMVRIKIETKGEVRYGNNVQKNHSWEYAFAIRNGHRVNSGSGSAQCHFTHLNS